MWQNPFLQIIMWTLLSSSLLLSLISFSSVFSSHVALFLCRRQPPPHPQPLSHRTILTTTVSHYSHTTWVSVWRQLVCSCYSDINLSLLYSSFSPIHPPFSPSLFSNFKNRWLCIPTLLRSIPRIHRMKCDDERAREQKEGVDRQRQMLDNSSCCREDKRKGTRKNREMRRKKIENGMIKRALV